MTTLRSFFLTRMAVLLALCHLKRLRYISLSAVSSLMLLPMLTVAGHPVMPASMVKTWALMVQDQEWHKLHLLHLLHERRLSILRDEAQERKQQQQSQITAIQPVTPQGSDVGDYTFSQLEQLWESAGGPSAIAPVMAAIALAESSGNPDAYNSSGASGLWQILGAVNASDQSNLFNPQVNAHEAVLKYNSQGLGAWVTYTSGAYLQFLNGNSAASSGGSNAASGSQVNTVASESSLDPSDALNSLGELFHGAASGLNWLFWLWEPGQGWRFALGVGGVASGVAAAKLYTSPSVSQEKSAAFPAAIMFTGVSLMCLYMTMRAWPVDTNGKAIRPAAYAVMILKGQKPPSGPPAPDNTLAIQGGLEALAAVWIVNKAAGSISNIAGAAGILGGLWGWIKGAFSGGGEEIPVVPDAVLTLPNVPGLSTSTT